MSVGGRRNRAESGKVVGNLPWLVAAAGVFLCAFVFLPTTIHATYVKYTLFQTLFLVLLVCLLGRALGLFPFSWLGPRGWGSEGRLAAAFVGLFFLVNALSAFWSDFPRATRFRTLELGFYAGWFFLVAGFLVKRDQVRRVGWTYVAAAAITAAGAFIAYYYRDRIDFFDAYEGRIGFPAGNPIFLAGYLLPPLFICLFSMGRWVRPDWFGIEEANRSAVKAGVLGLLAIFFMVAIYYTRSESGWIGLAFAFGVALLFVGRRLGWHLALEIASAGLFAGVTGAAIWVKVPVGVGRLALLVVLFGGVAAALVFKPTRALIPYFAIPAAVLVAAGGYFIEIRPKLPQMFAEGVKAQSTVALRVILWGAGLRMLLERPLLGWGAGTFISNFDVFAPPAYYVVQPAGTMAMDAHCEPLEIAVEVGVVGLCFALLAVWFIFRSAWKGLGAKRIDAAGVVGWGIFAGTAGMLMQEVGSVGMRFWDFAPFVWTNFGLLVALAPDRSAEVKGEVAPGGGRLARVVAFVLLLVCLGFFWKAVALDDLLSQKYRKDAMLAQAAASYAVRLKNQQGSIGELERRHGIAGRRDLSDFTATSLASSAQAFSAEAREYADLAARKSHSMENFLRALYDKAYLYRIEEKPAEAEATLEELERESPSLANTRLTLGIYYQEAGDKAKALANIAAYLHQDPLSSLARGRVLALLKELEPDEAASARKELQKIAASFRHDSIDTHQIMAALYQIEGRIKSAAEELEVAVNMGTVSPKAIADLVRLWRGAGDEQRARSWLERGLKAFADDETLTGLIEQPAKPEQR